MTAEHPQQVNAWHVQKLLQELRAFKGLVAADRTVDVQERIAIATLVDQLDRRLQEFQRHQSGS